MSKTDEPGTLQHQSANLQRYKEKMQLLLSASTIISLLFRTLTELAFAPEDRSVDKCFTHLKKLEKVLEALSDTTSGVK